MQTTMSKPKPEEEESGYVTSASQTVSTSQMQSSQTWGTQLNTLYGAAGPSPVNPVPTSTKISFDATADAYEITYPNGFSHTISKSDVENDESIRKIVNSILTKP